MRKGLRLAGFSLLPGIAYFPAAVCALTDSQYLNLELEQLLQVSVSGSTLRDESLRTVPAVVTVFTREQLDTLGLDYLFEIMRLVPGFQVTRVGDHQINYTFSAAGRRTAVRAREIALVVDGRLVVDPRSAGADSAFALFPLANIERVEVILGPGSAIYGSGAFTGLINVVSRRRGKLLSLGAGSEHRRKLDLHWNHNQGDWQVNVFAHAYGDRGYEYHLGNDAITRDPRAESALDMGVQYRQTRLQLAWFKFQADDFYALEKVRNRFNDFQPEYRHLTLEQAFNPTAAWSMKLNYHYQSADQYLDAPLSAAGALAAISTPPSAEPLLAKVNFYSRANKLAWANDLSINNNASLQWGLEWLVAENANGTAYTNFDLGQMVQGQLPINYYGDFEHPLVIETSTRRDTAGAYGQWLQDIGPDTRLTLGLRYDHYESIGNHLSPRLGLVHQLNEHHSLKLLYGDAFRAPSFAETRLTNNPFLRGNPDLDHELVKTWSLVWVGMWKKSSANLALFHNRYQDPIITGFNEAGTRTYINSDDQQSQGASLDLKQQVGEAWLMRLSLTRLTDLPDSAFAEADKLAAYILNYHKGAWNWNISLNYQGARAYLRTTSQREALDSYWLTNSQLSYQLTKGTRIKFITKNLTDEQYASPPQGAGVIGGIPNRGREWSLGVDWHW